MLTSCYMLTSLVSLQQRNVKKCEKSMKIVNIGGENLHIFWTTWGISIRLSGKTRLISHKKQGFTLLRKHIFGKTTGGGTGEGKLTPSLLRVKSLITFTKTFYHNHRRLIGYWLCLWIFHARKTNSPWISVWHSVMPTLISITKFRNRIFLLISFTYAPREFICGPTW